MAEKNVDVHPCGRYRDHITERILWPRVGQGLHQRQSFINVFLGPLELGS